MIEGRADVVLIEEANCLDGFFQRLPRNESRGDVVKRFESGEEPFETFAGGKVQEN
jgi:hypothetical protein